jgi:hypothetical protein
MANMVLFCLAQLFASASPALQKHLHAVFRVSSLIWLYSLMMLTVLLERLVKVVICLEPAFHPIAVAQRVSDSTKTTI